MFFDFFWLMFFIYLYFIFYLFLSYSEEYKISFFDYNRVFFYFLVIFYFIFVSFCLFYGVLNFFLDFSPEVPLVSLSEPVVSLGESEVYSELDSFIDSFQEDVQGIFEGKEDKRFRFFICISGLLGFVVMMYMFGDLD